MSLSRLTIATVIACMIGWPLIASAHPIAVTRGVVIVDGANVAVSLQEAGESLIHELPAMHNGTSITRDALEEAFARRASRMVRRLEVRDAAGRLLQGRLVRSNLSRPPESSESSDFAATVPIRAKPDAAWRGVRATYELSYVADAPLTFVTLRQSPDEDALLPSQFAMSVRCKAGGSERFVRLTSAGNAETLDVATNPPNAAIAAPTAGRVALDSFEIPASMLRHRFKSIQAVVRRATGHIIVDAFIPLTLLETWSPIERLDGDFLTPDEQRAACKAAVTLISQRVSLRRPSRMSEQDVWAAAAIVQSTAVIGPEQVLLCDDADAAKISRTLGSWSARVAVRMEFTAPLTMAEFELDWRLFNPAVLTADLLLIEDVTAREHQVTTYNPTVVLNLSAPHPKEPIAQAIEPGA